MIDEYIERIPFSGCWIWMGKLDRGGYGRYGKESRAHRYFWSKENGSIPPRMCICHRCDVRCCINPDHLFLGTYKDNLDDMISKGRSNVPHGVRCRTAKLTPELVIEIRRSYVRNSAEFGLVGLGLKYGVNHTTIGRIVRGQHWKITIEERAK